MRLVWIHGKRYGEKEVDCLKVILAWCFGGSGLMVDCCIFSGPVWLLSMDNMNDTPLTSYLLLDFLSLFAT